MTHRVKWIDRGVEPKERPDPRYPDGIHLDMSAGQWLACIVELPYPARRCGYYRITCNECHYSVVVTTAGRKDDPRSVKLACGGVDRSRLQ